MNEEGIMTEAEWLNCANPFPMIAFLRGKVSERKVRLFAVACCRLIWHQMTDGSSRNAVEVAEKFADGKATPAELASARAAAPRPYIVNGLPYHDELASIAAAESAAESIDVKEVVYRAFQWGDMMNEEEDNGDLVAACILRDIFDSLPFRPVTISPGWLTSTVVALARTTYEEKLFDLLPILADALEDAGCTDTAILYHLRGPGPHVRGCWVIDLLLGRE